MAADKMKAYLGFALRARKLVLGVNAVKVTRGRVDLLIADKGASPNTKKKSRASKSAFPARSCGWRIWKISQAKRIASSRQ
ncbi:MAG: hypothetical protein IKD43_05080 [Clostridia bacterium]|nr:hypothetical protein [Clostridia bacterium]